MPTRPEIPEEIEEYRDIRWRREGARQVSTAIEAERFIEQVGVAACLTDSRRPGPSLYIAVCGRRDAVMPKNVQKDEEASAAWLLKDEIVRRGQVYYGKLARGKATFIAPRMVAYFNAVWGLKRTDEKKVLSRNAQKILKVLRKEWEMATSDLKSDSGVTDRKAFTVALDELQAAMLVIPEGVYYEPKFTYHLDAGGVEISRSAHEEDHACGRSEGDRPQFPEQRRTDGSRRTGPRDRVVASRSRAWQSRAREGRLCDHAGPGVVSVEGKR